MWVVRNLKLMTCHPGTFVFWPSHHLSDMTPVGAHSNCSGEFGAKSSDFRDEGLNIFSWRHGGQNDGWWLGGIETGLQSRLYKFCNIKDSLICEPCLLLCASKWNSEEHFATFFGNISLEHSWGQDAKKPIRLPVGLSVPYGTSALQQQFLGDLKQPQTLFFWCCSKHFVNLCLPYTRWAINKHKP